MKMKPLSQFHKVSTYTLGALVGHSGRWWLISGGSTNLTLIHLLKNKVRFMCPCLTSVKHPLKLLPANRWKPPVPHFLFNSAGSLISLQVVQPEL